MELVDAKLGLIKVELKEEAAVTRAAGRSSRAARCWSAIGFALVNVAVAFFISSLFSFDERINYALGFVITGGSTGLGGIIVVLMKNRLAAHDRRRKEPSRR